MVPEVKLGSLPFSKELSEGIPDAGTFEGIPKIRTVAGDLRGGRVKGKVVIITGTNSPLGMGRATAHQFAANGARAIYLCDFSSDHLETHKRELASLYPSVEVHTRTFDAADEASVRAVVDHAIDTYKRLDVFFANAGITSMKLIWDVDSEGFMNMMRTNALSVYLAAKYAGAAMLKTSDEKPYPSGSIVTTASVAGHRSNGGSADYSASKAAAISLMQTCAYQLMGTGVRCNAVCPGLTQTGMTNELFNEVKRSGGENKLAQLNPTMRGAVPDEIARVVVFLASDEASYVNGQAWAVDGGMSAGHPFILSKLA